MANRAPKGCGCAVVLGIVVLLVLGMCSSESRDEQISENPPSSGEAGSGPATVTSEGATEVLRGAGAGSLQLCDAIDEALFAEVGVEGPYRNLEHVTDQEELESACWSYDESLLLTAVRHSSGESRASCAEDAIWSGGLIISPTEYAVDGGALSVDEESGTTTGGWVINDYCVTLLLHSDPLVTAGARQIGTAREDLAHVAMALVPASRSLLG
ncbi:hypothetical protein GCM10009832_05940 [Dietzia kunjamensis subsp. schimae]